MLCPVGRARDACSGDAAGANATNMDCVRPRRVIAYDCKAANVRVSRCAFSCNGSRSRSGSAGPHDGWSGCRFVA